MAGVDAAHVVYGRGDRRAGHRWTSGTGRCGAVDARASDESQTSVASDLLAPPVVNGARRRRRWTLAARPGARARRGVLVLLGLAGRLLSEAPCPSADQDGFEEFVAARRPALLRTAYLLTGSHADAEDLVQVALVKVVPHWKRIADRPEPYVRQVLARESVSRWRRRRWREAAHGRPARARRRGPDLAEREALRRALGALAPRQRAVIVLRYYEDLTEKETASVLGIAVGTVKSQARDALARLRELLPDLELDETGQCRRCSSTASLIARATAAGSARSSSTTTIMWLSNRGGTPKVSGWSASSRSRSRSRPGSRPRSGRAGGPPAGRRRTTRDGPRCPSA